MTEPLICNVCSNQSVYLQASKSDVYYTLEQQLRSDSLGPSSSPQTPKEAPQGVNTRAAATVPKARSRLSRQNAPDTAPPATARVFTRQKQKAQVSMHASSGHRLMRILGQRANQLFLSATFEQGPIMHGIIVRFKAHWSIFWTLQNKGLHATMSCSLPYKCRIQLRSVATMSQMQRELQTLTNKLRQILGCAAPPQAMLTAALPIDSRLGFEC